MLAYEYMEDMRHYIGARNYAVVYDVRKDAHGNIESIKARFAKSYRPTDEQLAKLARANSGLKWPSYTSVLQAHYKTPVGPSELSPYKVATVRPTPESVIREAIITFRRAVYSYLPDGLVKLAIQPDSAPVAPLFHAWGFPVEKLLWLKAKERGEEPDAAWYASATRQAPYGVATDGPGFWWWLHSPGALSNSSQVPAT